MKQSSVKRNTRRNQRQTAAEFTAVIQPDGKWWIGWVEEIAGVNGQGRTRAACCDSLRSALREALIMNREEALANAEQPYEEVSIAVGNDMSCSPI
jgi:predicted RNase H-like HicB family nuclease